MLACSFVSAVYLNNFLAVGGMQLSDPALNTPALISLKNGLDIWQKVQAGELLVGAAVGPRADEADFVAVQEPCGALLDGGLLQIVGERGQAGKDCVAREDVSAGVNNAGLLALTAKWRT